MQAYLPSTNVTVFIYLGALAFSSAHFGPGNGRIFVDDVFCSGREERLIDCYRSSTVSCSRGHSEDAGVRCQGKVAENVLYLSRDICT